MKNWGYKIPSPRVIDLDKADTSGYTEMVNEVPSAKRCFMCGACSATCPVSNHTDFSFRRCHILFKRGQVENLSVELDKCMLCGKCNIVCPRGVNTRAIISTMKIILTDMNNRNNPL
jgi:heterodisulfide reductase subunit C